MISDFREGGRFSKIRESLCKKPFSIGGKLEIGGGVGSKNDPKNQILFMDGPLVKITWFASQISPFHII